MNERTERLERFETMRPTAQAAYVIAMEKCDDDGLIPNMQPGVLAQLLDIDDTTGPREMLEIITQWCYMRLARLVVFAGDDYLALDWVDVDGAS